jgi:hypothetical protein
MFFEDKMNLSEVIKWGILAGFLEGAFIGIAGILYSQRQLLLSVVSGWEHGVTLVLLSLIALGAIVTTVIVFAHPLYCLLRGHYRDAFYTVILTSVTLIAILGFTVFTYRQLFN